MGDATSANGTPPADARGAAVLCLERGYAPLPLPLLGKNPALAGWPDFRLAPGDLDRYFPAGRASNLGVLLGDPSGGLVDTDLDSDWARRAAPVLLPETGMVTGRRSAPDSHYWYVVADPPRRAADDYDDPTDGRHLMEFRSTGGQTVLPPSIYPSEPGKGRPKPEPCVWHRGGLPARVALADLKAAVGATAAAALLGRHWPDRRRHVAALALAGGLLRAGWPEEKAERFVWAVCAAASDEEPDDRARAVADTAEALKAGDNATGWPTLARAFGEKGELIVRTVREWLGVRILNTPGRPAGRASEASGVGQRRHAPVPPWVAFPTHLLPPPWAEFVGQGAAGLGRAEDRESLEALIALPVLSALAAAVGNTRRVHVGAEWFEPAVFWTCSVAESGGRKSPAADLPMDLVKARQKRLVKAFKDDLAEWKQGAAKREKGDESDKPVLKRALVGDVTIEKLSALLDDNRRGLLVYRDELAGWLGSFTRYKGRAGGTDEPNWLSMHRADAIIYDRKTGDKTSVFVPHAAVSVAGGIQPAVLKRLAAQNLFDSGMVARILFAMPPRTVKVWSDRGIDGAVREAAEASLEALYALAGEPDEDGDVRPVVVKLAPAAKERMKRFVNEWGVRQYEADGDRASALAKLEAVPARFALLHHLAGGGDGPIGADSVEAGIALAEWFANEADRVYALIGQTDEERQTDKLLDAVTRLAGRHGGRLTARQLQQSNGRKYRSAVDAEAALESLVGLGLGTWEDGEIPAGGGHRPRYFRPCPTPDTSYTRPPADGGDDPAGDDDVSDGRSDTRPPPDRPDGGGPAVPPTANGVYEHLAGRPSGRVYEVSGVGHGHSGGEERGLGEAVEASECRTSPGPSVGQGAEPGPAEDDAFDFGANAPDGDDGPNPPPAGQCHGAVAVAADPETLSAPGKTDAGYTLVTTTDGLAEVVAAIEGAKLVGLDTETTGLDSWSDRVRLLQVAVPGRTFVLDLSPRYSPLGAAPYPALDPLWAALGRAEVVAHNAQFDVRFLARRGFVPGPLFCTMLASQLLYAGHRTKTGGRLKHSLEVVAERELGVTLDKLQQKTNWSKPLTADQLRYAAADAAVLLPLAAALKGKLADAKLSRTAELEMRALPMVAAAEPVAVDAVAWGGLADAAAAEAVRLRGAMDALAPAPGCLPGVESRNWNSPEQVKAAFGGLGVELAGTGDDTLAGVDHPLAAALRAYRAATKLSGTYGRGWLKQHVSAADGTVRPSWHQLGAESGRMSCSGPNLQQVPNTPEYRRCFVARRGRVLVRADFSQIELRAAARVSLDNPMRAALLAGRDLHTLTAARVLGKPEVEVTKADRQLAKALNFGLLFGMGWKGLKGYAESNYGVGLTDDQARGYREAFFKAYPGLKKWHQEVGGLVDRAFRKDPAASIAWDTLGGRKRAIPVAKRDRTGKAYPNKTEALNFPVQGLAADGLKASLGLMWDRRAEAADLGVRPVLYVHDEVVVEVGEKNAEGAAAWLKACMLDGMDRLLNPVKAAVDVSIGTTWGG